MELHSCYIIFHKINMYCIFRSQHTFEHAITKLSIVFNTFILVTIAFSHDITAINVLMNSFVCACKWSIRYMYFLFKFSVFLYFLLMYICRVLKTLQIRCVFFGSQKGTYVCKHTVAALRLS